MDYKTGKFLEDVIRDIDNIDVMDNKESLKRELENIRNNIMDHLED